ncbi:uncharacterized protein At4g06744-like, partial [Carica papaya]|uniref:uncharacterized protein At4g06744-like n=1 Tax=Carica papaya TaxID=3649 RepID=UPI000B8CE05D
VYPTTSDNLGSSRALYITFANNNFTGPIPASIGKAPFLLEILLLNNQLSGCLPYEIGFLMNLTVFDAGDNILTGTIPYSFACLQKIEFLNLANNMFYGEVPESVCMLPNLRNLSLSGNFFTQIGPECRKLMYQKRLDVRRNCIIDQADQRSKAECAAFYSRRYICQKAKYMKLIPCKNADYHSNSSMAEMNKKVKKANPPSPVSYGALSPNRL